MNEYDTIEKHWKGKLSKFARDSLKHVKVPNATVNLLVEIGLPRTAPLLVEFKSDASDLRQLSVDNAIYYEAGSDGGTCICIEEGNGWIWSVDESGVLPKRFINSSLLHFLLFLATYDSHVDALKAASDEEAISEVAAIREKFVQLDPLALKDEESWWSVVLEQTEQGLL